MFLSVVAVIYYYSLSFNSVCAKTALPPVVIQGDGNSTCPAQQYRKNGRQTLMDMVASSAPYNCGSGEWNQVAYLNMSDSMQACPTNWHERSANGVRACGILAPGCYGTFYPTDHSYSRVCGRVIGYQVGHTDGFHSTQSIDMAYVEGVSITHGSPRSHIWSLTADLYESQAGCPCEGGPIPPPFVGNNYYCESGNNGTSSTNDILHVEDPIWDGKQCEFEGTCCSNAPWFTVDLNLSTSDSIEVRICTDSGPTEDTPIHMLELYVQ